MTLRDFGYPRVQVNDNVRLWFAEGHDLPALTLRVSLSSARTGAVSVGAGSDDY